MKVLIDSDVCLDVLSARQPYVNMSLNVFKAMIDKRFAGIISADSFTNIFYLLRKGLGNENAVKKLTALRKTSHVGAILPSTIDSALTLGWPDFEDALQYRIALENECEFILTRNTADFKGSTIPVMVPADFVVTVLH